MPHIRRAGAQHHGLQLVRHGRQDFRNARRALFIVGLHQRLAHADGVRAEGQGLEGVKPVLDPAVNNEEEILPHSPADIRQQRNIRRGPAQQPVVVAQNDARAPDFLRADSVLHAEGALDQEGQLCRGDIALQLLQGRELHLVSHNHGVRVIVRVDRVLHVHAHRRGPVLLGKAQAGEDFLLVCVRLDDLDDLRAGGQHLAQLRVVAHADLAQGAGVPGSPGEVRHTALQMAERRRHDGRRNLLAQERCPGVGMHGTDDPALHHQGIQVFPRDPDGIAFDAAHAVSSLTVYLPVFVLHINSTGRPPNPSGVRERRFSGPGKNRRAYFSVSVIYSAASRLYNHHRKHSAARREKRRE